MQYANFLKQEVWRRKYGRYIDKQGPSCPLMTPSALAVPPPATACAYFRAPVLPAVLAAAAAAIAYGQAARGTGLKKAEEDGACSPATRAC
eukprot:scaffold27075_cov19-Tisochrysis_lutea.AAC.1